MKYLVDGVSLDFDDMLYNLCLLNTRYLKLKYGLNVNPLDIKKFSYYIDNGYETIIKDLWDNPEKYLESDLYEGALEFFNKIKKLVGRNNLQIVTSSFPNVIKEKDNFIKNILQLDCDVIHTKDKYLYTKNTILVDDCLDNIISHVEKNQNPGIIFNLGFGWNLDHQEDNNLIFRGNSYDETFDLIEYIINN